MGQGAVSPGSRDGIERNLQQFRTYREGIGGANFFKPGGCIHLRDGAGWLHIEPIEEFRKGNAISKVGAVAAFNFSFIFGGAWQDDRVPRLNDFATICFDYLAQEYRHAGRIDLNAGVFCQFCQFLIEGSWRVEICKLCQIGFQFARKLSLVDEQQRQAFCA